MKLETKYVSFGGSRKPLTISEEQVISSNELSSVNYGEDDEKDDVPFSYSSDGGMMFSTS